MKRCGKCLYEMPAPVDCDAHQTDDDGKCPAFTLDTYFERLLPKPQGGPKDDDVNAEPTRVIWTRQGDRWFFGDPEHGIYIDHHKGSWYLTYYAMDVVNLDLSVYDIEDAKYEAALIVRRQVRSLLKEVESYRPKVLVGQEWLNLSSGSRTYVIEVGAKGIVLFYPSIGRVRTYSLEKLHSKWEPVSKVEIKSAWVRAIRQARSWNQKWHSRWVQVSHGLLPSSDSAPQAFHRAFVILQHELDDSEEDAMQHTKRPRREGCGLWGRGRKLEEEDLDDEDDEEPGWDVLDDAPCPKKRLATVEQDGPSDTPSRPSGP